MSILVVEDNPISLRTLEMLLHSHGLETIQAKTGKQALEKLASRKDIQLVLSDLMMPEMDGYELLEAIGRDESLKQIPVIIMTSISDAETVRKVVGLGCRHYLVKPIREETLLPKVRQHMIESPGSDQPLRSKFQILEETGLSPEKYEELFDTFRAQVVEVSAAFENGPDPASKDDAAGKLAMSLREGAQVLAQGALPALLEAFRAQGSCDWQSFRQSLASTSKAMAAAAEKRDRLREKLAARADAASSGA